MSADHSQPTLPPGFSVIEDAGRFVLWDHHTDDSAPEFASYDDARAKAWTWWREIYQWEEIA